MDAATIKELLKQQQSFLVDVLGSQRTWMETQLERQKYEFQKLQVETLEKKPTLDNATSGSHMAVPAFSAFDCKKQHWDSYIPQMSQHFTAYRVSDAQQKRAFFLSWIGAENFELLVKLFGSEDVQGQSYDELVAKLTAHFKANVHVLASRYELFKLKMKPNQKYSEWIAELRGVARSCKYVCRNDACKTEFVDELIRDIIVLNTPHDSVRTAALQKVDPSLADIILVAEAFEATQMMKQRMSTEKEKHEVFQLKNVPAKSQNNEVASRYSSPLQSCSGCGVHHQREKCKFRKAQCRKCNRFGHIAPVCSTGLAGNRSNKQQNKRQQRQLKGNEQNNAVMSLNILDSIVNNVPIKVNRKYMITLLVNDVPLQFQIDSGATCSVIGRTAYNKLGSPELQFFNQSHLTTYGGGQVDILGTIKVVMQLGQIRKEFQLVVSNIEQEGEILGTDLIDELGLCTCQVHINTFSSSTVCDVDNLIQKFSDVFNGTLGHCNSFKAQLHVKENAIPKYFRSRPLPFAQMDAFKSESQRLVDIGIWKPLNFSSWAAPIVVVPKQDGCIRICGDFKAVNAQLHIDQYPIPRIEELFQKLRGGKLFAKIDLSDAYLQVELDEESKAVMVVNTPAGLFQYQRLPFGVASAPAIFQKLLEQVISGIPLCVNYLDDIIVGGTSATNLIANLDQVFSRLQENGFTCRRSKCSFMQSEVEYLGFIINADGISPSSNKVTAIRDLPRPNNLKDLQAFLGKINYYNKFINNFAQVAAPLNKLRRVSENFKWGEEQEQAFLDLKGHLSSAPLLAHFDDNLPIVLATDASSFGIGAVISHRLPDGLEKPVAFASKTLDEHQRRYSQIEKEALSIIFGVKKFHQYLYGRTFTLLTDHKPLVTIFSPDKQLPVLTMQRLQRWALTLMAYQYKIQYRSTDKHSNADALSRLPHGPDTEFDRVCCLQLNVEQQLDDFPLNASRLKLLTVRDTVLQRVYKFISEGWPEKLSKENKDLQPYFTRRFALSFERGVILLQTDYSRVVVPAGAQVAVLDLLHEGHWGMTRMKQMARRHCWWPNMDSSIEHRVSKCNLCQQQSTASPAREFLSWPKAERPWQRIHLDFAGPFLDAMWLICIDAFSKYPYITKMSSTTAALTIDALNVIFATEGFPDAIVSDNGRQFIASEFQEFCTARGIQHLTTAPFHPASNGEAERNVRTFKQSLKKAVAEGNSKASGLLTFLSTFRSCPNPLTGKSPAELLHGRQPKGTLSLLLPTAIPNCNPHEASKSFEIADSVFVKNFARGPPWIPGVVKAKSGRIMYKVQTSQGILRRHYNQIKRRVLEEFADTSPVTKSNNDVQPHSKFKPLRRSNRIHQRLNPPIYQD